MIHRCQIMPLIAALLLAAVVPAAAQSMPRAGDIPV